MAADVTWVLESDVFPNSDAGLRRAIWEAGHTLVDWDDAWWADGLPPGLGKSVTVFHGSLGNADRIATEVDWCPGSYCNSPAFCCSAWYERARPWLLHSDWRILPANAFVANAASIAADLGCTDRVFVRPDSPLKPFSGRMVETSSVTLATLDHGFYFDDEALPVVVAPVQNVGREWRFIVINESIVTGSAYDQATRSAIADTLDSNACAVARTIAASLPSPADVYVLDLCESDGALRLLELNPFGGADLYACDPSIVVESVAGAAREAWLRKTTGQNHRLQPRHLR
jgi:hypothetical protein